jgi:hypothetical protein
MGFKVSCISVMGILVSISPAVAHDWYKDLTSRNGLSCCNDRDCQRVGHRYTSENGHEVEIEGYWTSVEPNVILPLSSPDGQTHACFERSWSSLYGSHTSIRFIVRCVILGGEA